MKCFWIISKGWRNFSSGWCGGVGMVDLFARGINEGTACLLGGKSEVGSQVSIVWTSVVCFGRWC